ncbi:hypothetical protein INT43_002230 [Umbelopsis isabellina]|uniref:U3 small nucleolar RNA-associated protein 15 C-terminal domain-containing protein n=1 Tax=Mortierella isabellina TaxID=91625 RepID=A0A8H7Q4M2_MORIS|nr:hypothetical protein INT43_002230 [Umbelopsis isabellina]
MDCFSLGKKFSKATTFPQRFLILVSEAMGDYQKLQVKKYARLPSRQTNESRFWKKFKSPIAIKEYAEVSSINFSQVAPYEFAVTSSTRVQIYSSKTHQPKKTISRFKDTAFSGTFRHDGKLVIAGDATGLVQIFDVNSRAILRQFQGHKLPVHVTKFSNDSKSVLSGSDDKTLRVWDVSTSDCLNEFTDHTDYIRAGLVSAENPNLIVSGSYDQTVKLWDMRSNSCVMTMNHGAPVEDVLMYPGGGAIVSAGGTSIKVWDLLSGGRAMHSVSNHQKTITSMCFDGSCSRLLTGSLDQHVKIYNVMDYKVVHSIKYPSPVMSVGISPTDSTLAVGMANGYLSIRQRQAKSSEVAMKKMRDDYVQGGTYKYFVRGQSHQGGEDDFRIEAKRQKRLQQYDQYLKKFQYGNALDEVLRTHQMPIVVVSLLQELIHRDGLKMAIAGRDDISLEPIVRFVVKHINQPRYVNLLIDVANATIDMYSPALGQSPLIDDLISRLRDKVKQEIKFQKDLMQTLASMEMLFAKSAAGGNHHLSADTANPLVNA